MEWRYFPGWDYSGSVVVFIPNRKGLTHLTTSLRANSTSGDTQLTKARCPRLKKDYEAVKNRLIYPEIRNGPLERVNSRINKPDVFSTRQCLSSSLMEKFLGKNFSELAGATNTFTVHASRGLFR